MYLSSYTVAAVPENIFYCYVLHILVCVFYYLCFYPDICSYQSLCFQDSTVYCNTNLNSLSIKMILNQC